MACVNLHLSREELCSCWQGASSLFRHRGFFLVPVGGRVWSQLYLPRVSLVLTRLEQEQAGAPARAQVWRAFETKYIFFGILSWPRTPMFQASQCHCWRSAHLQAPAVLTAGHDHAHTYIGSWNIILSFRAKICLLGFFPLFYSTRRTPVNCSLIFLLPLFRTWKKCDWLPGLTILPSFWFDMIIRHSWGWTSKLTWTQCHTLTQVLSDCFSHSVMTLARIQILSLVEKLYRETHQKFLSDFMAL